MKLWSALAMLALVSSARAETTADTLDRVVPLPLIEVST